MIFYFLPIDNLSKEKYDKRWTAAWMFRQEGDGMRIAICDDDFVFAEKLRQLVLQGLKEWGVEPEMTVYHGGGAFLEEQPVCDAVFLDIDMPGVNGFKLAGQMGEALILFVSCHDELVYSSLKFRPFRFIRKSRLEEELPESLEALNRAVLKRNAGKKLPFQAKTGEVFLDTEEIEYIEIYGHWLQIHGSGGRDIECYGSLSEFEKRLLPFGFVRTHKSYLVNCKYIYSIENGQVVLDDGTGILLSRYKAEAVRKAFLNYMRGET